MHELRGRETLSQDLDLKVLKLCELEELFNQSMQTLALGSNNLKVISPFARRQRRFLQLQGFNVAPERGQWCAQVVGDARNEVPDGETYASCNLLHLLLYMLNHGVVGAPQAVELVTSAWAADAYRCQTLELTVAKRIDGAGEKTQAARHGNQHNETGD